MLWQNTIDPVRPEEGFAELRDAWALSENRVLVLRAGAPFDDVREFYTTNLPHIGTPCVDSARTCIVIRPFMAGEMLTSDQPTPREQLDAALDHPAIKSAVLSTSNLAHLNELIA